MKLEYNSHVWSPSYNLERYHLYRKSSKTIYIKNSGVQNFNLLHQRLKKFNLESLELRRLRADLKFTYKLIFNKTTADYTQFFTIQTPTDRQLRSHSYQIRPTQRVRTNRSNHCLFYRIATIWNTLPPSTNFTSLTTFTNSIPIDFLIRFCKFNFG